MDVKYLHVCKSIDICQFQTYLRFKFQFLCFSFAIDLNQLYSFSINKMSESGKNMNANQTSNYNSIFLSVFKSKVDISLNKLFTLRNQKTIILILFCLIPLVGFSNTPIKKAKRAKTVKTIKRNILEIEFGTFNYNSPVLTKKINFLG